MKNEKLLEAIGAIDDNLIHGAVYDTPKKKQPVWVKVGAMAACLCLVICGAVLWKSVSKPSGNMTDYGGGPVQGGDMVGAVPEGVDPVVASVAVYPATERIENVATAEVVSLSENEAISYALAAHLPVQLPEGFHYGRGSVYNTVMKDGTQYNMLRIEYSSGTISEQQLTEDGGTVAPDLDVMGEHFTVCVMNYEPKTNISIYASKEDVTQSLLDKNSAAYIRSGDCYVGVFVETATPEAVFDALRSISADE